MVTITRNLRSNTKFADLMKETRVIKLKELSTNDIRCKCYNAGSFVLKITGKESADKPEKLVDKLRGLSERNGNGNL